MRFGADRARAYRLPVAAERRRQQLANLAHAQVLDLITGLLIDEHRAGRWVHRTANRAMAYVMAKAIRHGAYRVGVIALAVIAGCHARTVIRASNAARQSDVPWLYRVERGTRGVCVTCWSPTPDLIDAVWQRWQAHRKSGKRERKRRTDSRRLGDTVAEVAPPLRSGPVTRGPAPTNEDIPASAAVRELAMQAIRAALRC